MARNSAERLVASVIWSREDPRFPGHRQHGQPTFQHPLQVWCYADYKGVVCPLHRCTVTVVPHVQMTSSRVRLDQSFKTVGCGCTSCWGDVGPEV